MKQRCENIVWINPHGDLPVKVLELSGPEYGSHDERLQLVRRLMQDMADEPAPQCLVIDLSQVHYFGASFIGVLVNAWDQLRKQHRRFAICGLTPYCARLIQILQLDKLFDVYPTLRVLREKISQQSHGQKQEVTSGEIRIHRSDVAWDPNLVRLEYIGHDQVPIRSVIVPRGERS